MTAPNFGDNLTLLSALLGSMMPAAIAVILRRNWSSEVKGAVALVLCLIAAALLTWQTGNLNAADYVRSALIVFTMAQVLYQTYWKPSEIAPSIESRTG